MENLLYECANILSVFFLAHLTLGHDIPRSLLKGALVTHKIRKKVDIL